MKKQHQQNLIEMTVKEIDIWIEKMEEIKKSAQSRSNGILAKDFARSVRNTLDNCKAKMEAVERMASKK